MKRRFCWPSSAVPAAPFSLVASHVAGDLMRQKVLETRRGVVDNEPCWADFEFGHDELNDMKPEYPPLKDLKVFNRFVLSSTLLWTV